MINKKFYGVIRSCLAAIIISVPISFIMVVINIGLVKGFGFAFLKSALVGTLISVPLANIGIPIAERITKKFVKKYYEVIRSCLAAILISVPNSFIMVVINVGFVEGFGLAFLTSALVGLLISVPVTNIGILIAEKLTKKIVKN